MSCLVAFKMGKCGDTMFELQRSAEGVALLESRWGVFSGAVLTMSYGPGRSCCYMIKLVQSWQCMQGSHERVRS